MGQRLPQGRPGAEVEHPVTPAFLHVPLDAQLHLSVGGPMHDQGWMSVATAV
jgi:hypothetical protein